MKKTTETTVKKETKKPVIPKPEKPKAESPATTEPEEAMAVEDPVPSREGRFKIGQIVEHDGKQWLCLATHGEQVAVFVRANVQTTYSRPVRQECLLVSNVPVKE